MATKPLKTITFEGLDDTYTIPQVDDTLSVTGASADAKVTGDALKAKAEAEGAVSMAKALVGGKYTLDQSPYHYRQSPDAGSVDEKIVGGTLAWNQLVPTNKVHNTSTKNGITATNNSDGTVTLTGTATALTVIELTSSLSVFQNGHKYYLGSGGTGFRMYDGYSSHGYGIINCCVNKGETVTLYALVNNGITVNSKIPVVAYDLTTLFGSTIADYIYSLEQATAGAGVDWVRQYIDLDTYHEYCEPTLISVEGLQSRDVVGFNVWDEEWKAYSTTGIQSKNPIPVIEGATYYIEMPSGHASVNNVDKDGNYISFIGNKGNTTFTIPLGCKYICIVCASYGTTYNHDICINISDPSRNGTYEPYEKHSYPLDSSIELRGSPKLSDGKMYFDGDEYQSDGQVMRRYGIVDLGSLNWIASNNLFNPNTSIPNIVSVTTNLISPKYTPDMKAATRELDKSICVTNGGYIYIYDTSYSDVASFKTAMSGVMLLYELATPTTESAQPYQSPQLAGSTEEYVTTGVVPVGHESRYYEDITGKVNNLPSDFSTLIAPVEKSFTATRNYTVGSFVIVNNQLYKVTSAISSGGTITPNSNCTATTIMAEILALA